MQKSAALARQIHTSRGTESEGPNVVVKFRRAQPYGNLDRTHVARFRQNGRDAHEPERFVIANAMSGNVNGPIFAIENFVGPGNLLVERRRQRDELESGA